MLASLWMASASAQSIWKWRDRDGRIQVSDRPPPVGVPDSAILQRPAGTRPVLVDADAPPAPQAALPASAPSGVDTELEARKRKQQAEQQAQLQARQQAEKAQQQGRRADLCARARNQLAALESGQRMARPNDKGEREILDDRGRSDEIRRSREVVAGNCGI